MVHLVQWQLVKVERADHNKKHMGLKSWKNAPDGKVVKTDVSIAKNYLEKEELAELNELCYDLPLGIQKLRI